MRPEGFQGLPAANVLVRTVDLDEDQDAALLALWDANQSDILPHVVVQSAPKWGAPATVFSGAFTPDTAAAVMDSPLRRQIAKRLLDGDSVVWVLLESGNTEADDKAFAMLEAELPALESKLKLPEIAQEDLGDLSVAPDALRIAFSAVRVSRDTPEEKVLVDMLLRVEPDLLEEPYVNQTMAFPVFGRGRALYALVGDGIAPDLIEEACQFLTGECQCTVKNQNPGVDLLMSVDWDQFVEASEPMDADLPPLAGFSDFVVEETVVASGDESDEASAALLDSGSTTPAATNAAGDSQTKDASAGTTSVVPGAATATPPAAPGPRGLSLSMLALLVVGGLILCAGLASFLPRFR